MRATQITAPVWGGASLLSVRARFQAMIRLAAALLLLSALSILSGPVSADGTSYSTAQRQFKVGILLVDSTTDQSSAATIAKGPENPDPYVFYIADAYNELKPSNWEFINPLAPATVTAAIRNRWLARDSRNPYQIGAKVRKDMAAYWEVPLSSTSIQDLLQFDLLFITSHRTTSFNPIDREKLRKLVDAGGIVWFENCGGLTIDPNAPFFLPQVQFQGTSIGPTKPVVRIPDHPILNTPFQLSYEEISQLGDKAYGNFSICTIDPTNVNNPPLQQAPNPETLANIVGNATTSNLPYIAAGNYGSGTIIITAGDTGCDINDYAGGVNAGYGGNSGAFSGPNIKTAHPEDLKFLYNLSAWGSANNTYRRNNRRMASSFEGVGGPLVSAFNITNSFNLQYPQAYPVDSRSAPLIIKNVMFISGLDKTTNQYTVRAYDINPFRDLDGDGNPDDGFPDLSLGLPYDEIWCWEGGSVVQGQYPSSPVYGSVLTNIPQVGQRQDVIFVTLPDGTVLKFEAFPHTANGVLSATPNVLSQFAGTGGPYDRMPMGVAPSPAFLENRVYTVEPNGVVVCFNALDNVEMWRTYNGTPPYQIKPCGSPTVGYARQDTNTAFSQASVGSTNDLMLYAPCFSNDSNNAWTGRIFAYWLGTRNEVVSLRNNRDPVASGGGVLNTRIAGGPGGPQADQYFMANGTTDGVGGNEPGVFVNPTYNVRVYSADLVTPPAPPVSAAQNYAKGKISGDYGLDYVETTTGKIHLKKIGSNNPPDFQQNPDILVAIDYDVAYVVGNKTPTAYSSNPTQVGARNNEALRVPYTDPTGQNAANGLVNQNYGLSTATFSPDDSLIYAANQFNNGNGGGPAPVASIFSVNEQEGLETSRVRWRFTLFNDIDGNSTTATRTVDDLTVEDPKPLLNYLKFPTLTSIAKQNQPEALTNIRIVGSPLTTNNGYTYVMAEGTSAYNNNTTVSILMAFKTSPQIVLTLPEAFEATRGITLSQADMLTGSESIVVRSGSPQLILDGDRGKITVVNSRAANNQAFSASQSFVVRYWPKGGTNEKRAIISPIPHGATLTYGTGTDEQGNQVTANPPSGPFSPLLWYYVLPGKPLSSPTLIGDLVYYNMNAPLGTGGAYVVAVDINPAANDPQVRAGYGEPVLNVVPSTTGVDHVAMMQPIDPNASPTAPPVGGSGVLALNSSVGTFALTDNVTLVADNRRLMEVAADSAARWVMDSTLSVMVAGGKLPVYGPNGQPIVIPGDPTPNGREVMTRQALSRPTSVQKVFSDYLFADSGNNRVVRTDRGGRITWQLSTFRDPYGLLTNGEPKSLNEPTDVQFYTALTYDANQTVSGYEIHYLIADAGNFRIIEVADYYGPNGNPVVAPGSPPNEPIGAHSLVWTTRTTADQGKKLRFLSLQRYLGYYVDSNNVPYTAYPYIAAVVGNSTVGTGSSQVISSSAGGALVRLKYAPFNTAIVARDGNNNPGILKPWVTLAQPPTGNGTVLDTVEQIAITPANAQPTSIKLVAPTFFRLVSLPAANGIQRILYLICDVKGAYVVRADFTGPGQPQLGMVWMFTQDDYNAINDGVLPNHSDARVFPTGRKVAFRPTSIQLLANGNILITNGATERNILFKSGQFVGEAFEVTPRNGSVILAAMNDPIQTIQFIDPATPAGTFAGFSAPKLVIGSAAGPNQQIMGKDNNTGLLEQPQIAIRP